VAYQQRCAHPQALVADGLLVHVEDLDAPPALVRRVGGDREPGGARLLVDRAVALDGEDALDLLRAAQRAARCAVASSLRKAASSAAVGRFMLRLLVLDHASVFCSSSAAAGVTGARPSPGVIARLGRRSPVAFRRDRGEVDLLVLRHLLLGGDLVEATSSRSTPFSAATRVRLVMRALIASIAAPTSLSGSTQAQRRACQCTRGTCEARRVEGQRAGMSHRHAQPVLVERLAEVLDPELLHAAPGVALVELADARARVVHVLQVVREVVVRDAEAGRDAAQAGLDEGLDRRVGIFRVPARRELVARRQRERAARLGLQLQVAVRRRSSRCRPFGPGAAMSASVLPPSGDSMKPICAAPMRAAITAASSNAPRCTRFRSAAYIIGTPRACSANSGAKTCDDLVGRNALEVGACSR
jgi:hypothetical protein